MTKYAQGTSSSIACTATGNKAVTYDSIGNITSKGSIGTYSYAASGAGSVLPHAVSSISSCTVLGCMNDVIANGKYY